jgi:hypothetical protein
MQRQELKILHTERAAQFSSAGTIIHISTPGFAIDKGYDQSMELTHSIPMGFFNEQNRNKKLE